MKNIILPLFISFTTLSLTTACNSPSNNYIENTSGSKASPELSSESKLIIEEYNSIILEFQNIDDETETLKKLKSIIPKLKQINLEKERYRLLMNSYLRIGDIEKAYTLTEEILAQNKQPNIKNFQCMLMETLNKPSSLIKDCYSAAASLYQHELNKLDSSAPNYTQILWGFNVNIFHAGHIEYRYQLKKIVDHQKNETDQQFYKNLFDLETNADLRQELLYSIASRI
ncbi:hypothetical protein [Acinetobacter indicus]|uniref:hypothetical protein n=1 Tax=Acinetobacter indicus TaxID=756892 RepID=UPI0014447DAF|nr:hypothetical protein [Acinetobacter indicus]